MNEMNDIIILDMWKKENAILDMYDDIIIKPTEFDIMDINDKSNLYKVIFKEQNDKAVYVEFICGDENSTTEINSLYHTIIQKLKSDFGVLVSDCTADMLGLCITEDYRVNKDCYCRVELELMLSLIIRRGEIYLELSKKGITNGDLKDIENLEKYINRLRKALTMLKAK